MEIVGGLKVENEFIKSENPTENESNVVEITAEDIQEEVEQEPGENGKLLLSNITVESQDIHNEDLINNQEYDDSSSDEEEEEDEDVQENLILNDKDHNLNDVQKNYGIPRMIYINIQHKQPPRNETSNSSTKKTIKNTRSSRSNPMRVLISDYTLENKQAEVKTYRCNLCKVVATSKKRIKQHIGQTHRDMALFYNKEEKLKELVNNTKSRYFAWYEYTVEDKEYRCGHCQVLHRSQKDVENHILENHRKIDQWKYCPHCPYKSLFNINHHLLYVHTDVKDIKYFNCDKCEYKAKVKTHLKRHIEAIHMDPNELIDKMYKCKQCNKLFKRHYVLQNHINVIHNTGTVEKIQCFHCSFECRSRDSMKHHIDSRHTKIENLETLKCTHCNFKTKFKLRLQSHTRNHRGVFQCHICSHHCPNKSQLELHLIGHKKEKNENDLKYRCDKCDYKTYRAYNLKIHKLNHLKPEEIQYFHCYHCPFKAKRKDNLKSHIFRHFKQDEVKFACYICDFTTQKSQIMIKHIDVHSKEAAKVKKKSKCLVTVQTVEHFNEIQLKDTKKNDVK